MISLDQITANAPDIILIVISGLACLYCAMLNRRLKKLNDLKTGVGASIVTLTEAIQNTHNAAQEAQTSTLEAVETLKALLETSESATPQVASLVEELEKARASAKAQKQQLEDTIEISLSHAITRAQNTATGLMDIISDINESKDRLKRERQTVQAEERDITAKAKSKSLNTAPGPHFDFGDDHQNEEVLEPDNKTMSNDFDDSHGEILQFAS